MSISDAMDEMPKTAIPGGTRKSPHRSSVEEELNSLVSPCKRLKLGPPLFCSTLLQTPAEKSANDGCVRGSSDPLCCSTPLPINASKKPCHNVRETGVGEEDTDIAQDTNINCEKTQCASELLTRNWECTENSVEAEHEQEADADRDYLKNLTTNENNQEPESGCNAADKIGGTENYFSDKLQDEWKNESEAVALDDTNNVGFKDSGVCFQDSLKENELSLQKPTTVNDSECRGLRIRNPNITREEKQIKRNFVIDTQMSKENFINEDHLPNPKFKKKKVNKFIEYTGPGFTTTVKVTGQKNRDNQIGQDIKTCMLQEYNGPGLTSVPEGKVVEMAMDYNSVKENSNTLSKKIPRGNGIFVDNVPVQESAKATVYQVLKNYNIETNTSSQTESEQTSGSTLRQFNSGSSSALKPDEVYPSLTDMCSKGENNSGMEKKVNHKVLQSQGNY